MRVITIEEHYRNAAIKDATGKHNASFHNPNLLANLWASLDDLGALRLNAMDEAGIDMQVLSHTTPATEVLPAAEAVPLARDANDQLADTIAANPDRFAGFATLPTPNPAVAAAELERAVRTLGFKGAMINGHTNGRFLDDPFFYPILERAAALDVPLYLHPTLPIEAVKEAYYGGFDAAVSYSLSAAGWGWHAETALHALRLILSGIFDRLPQLQIIIGHMGEMIPFYLGRIDTILSPVARNLQRRVSDYFLQNFYITTSGIFTEPPLLLALQVLGVDRIIFSIDYPYSTNVQGRTFLDRVSLNPADKEKISHGNAEKLLKL
jgi:predicted TIM-barrel fold metal-dependent hydrolase